MATKSTYKNTETRAGNMEGCKDTTRGWSRDRQEELNRKNGQVL